MREWIIFNKLVHFNSILNNTIDGFTQSGNLSNIDEHGGILPQTPLKEVFNQRWYIQHFMDENEDENKNPLYEEIGMKQIDWKFIKLCHSSQTFYDS